jgi:hypothetical protein
VPGLLLVASNRKGLAQAHLRDLGGAGRGRVTPGLLQQKFTIEAVHLCPDRFGADAL